MIGKCLLGQNCITLPLPFEHLYTHWVVLSPFVPILSIPYETPMQLSSSAKNFLTFSLPSSACHSLLPAHVVFQARVLDILVQVTSAEQLCPSLGCGLLDGRDHVISISVSTLRGHLYTESVLCVCGMNVYMLHL